MPVRVIVAVLSLATAVAQAQLRVPARNEIAEAMRKEKAVGYDILATANGARFSSSVILHFARQQAAASPVTPILLPHADYLEAFAEVSIRVICST